MGMKSIRVLPIIMTIDTINCCKRSSKLYILEIYEYKSLRDCSFQMEDFPPRIHSTIHQGSKDRPFKLENTVIQCSTTNS